MKIDYIRKENKTSSHACKNIKTNLQIVEA